MKSIIIQMIMFIIVLMMCMSVARSCFKKEQMIIIMSLFCFNFRSIIYTFMIKSFISI